MPTDTEPTKMNWNILMVDWSLLGT